MGKYIFEEIKREELTVLFRLIEERIAWMDDVGIKQWNVTDYTNVYPLFYYEAHFEKGEVYVLRDGDSGEIVSGAVLKTEDERWDGSGRWNDGEPSFYVHNLVSKLGCGGVGAVFLAEAERYARAVGKKYMRLDSAVDNLRLTDFYDRLGYEAVGYCEDGVYLGILRQKKIDG